MTDLPGMWEQADLEGGATDQPPPSIRSKAGFLARFTRHLVLRKGEVLLTTSEDPAGANTDLKVVEDLDDANLVTSRFKGEGIETHALLIDLDVPHEYVPSSTPGHGHLLVDVKLSHWQWQRAMRALADAGVISSGYRDYSEQRGFASLRLPWIKKEEKAA